MKHQKPPLKTFSFFGLPIFSGSYRYIELQIQKAIRAGEHIYICVTGAHGLVESMRNPSVYDAHKGARFIVPDGMPLVWLGKTLGYGNTERIYGPDVLLSLSSLASMHNYRIFLYGTTKTTLDALSRRLVARYPGLNIVGTYAPPYRSLTQAQSVRIVKFINSRHPQILFVGLSTPAQEFWMYEHSLVIKANVMIGIGAAIDFIAGTKKQAPKWMQKSGLEWLFRLTTEPGRLWRRYVVVTVGFILLSVCLLIRRLYKKISL